ncbi:MAG: VOC family protein [Halobacteriales archaeon]
MTGLVFFGTSQLEETVAFYTEEVGMEVWLEQSECTILKFDNMLLGFCEHQEAETEGTITFVSEDRDGVDAWYEQFADRAEDEPRVNEPFDIYNFFARDPEGRSIEFQTFLHPTDPV